jgi:hypothetical protein
LAHKNDQKHGQGTLQYMDGGVYKGNWLNDKQNGQGEMLTFDRVRKTGLWKDGKFVKGRSMQ